MALDCTSVQLRMGRHLYTYLFVIFIALIGISTCIAWFIYSSSTQEEGCPLHRLTLSYKSLNCVPVKGYSSKCPTSYDCSSYESRNTHVCHVFGNTYKISEAVVDSNLPPCFSNCFCGQSENGMAALNCTVQECHFKIKLNFCVVIQRPDQCCKTQHCGPGRELKNITCEYRNRTFDEGEYFGPSHEERVCKVCTCQSGFKGEMVEPHCKYLDCNLQVLYSDELNRGCVPVFVDPVYCCPYRWRCPAESDYVIESKNKTIPETSAKCKFGNLTIPYGDGINTEDLTKCTCELPPFLTCQRHSLPYY